MQQLQANTASLTVFGADIIHQIIPLHPHTVRSWRSRGFFSGGEKIGRGYVYNIADLAMLMILNEMQDVGVDMITASTGAKTAALDLVAHALRQAPLMELWAGPKANIDALVMHLRTEEDILPRMFGSDAESIDFQLPSNYLVTGGDDFDDWTLIDDLEELEEMEDFNLVTILLDLRKLAKRLINVLTAFPEASAGALSPRDTPPSVVNFYTKDCMEANPQIVQFSLNMTMTPIKRSSQPETANDL